MSWICLCDPSLENASRLSSQMENHEICQLILSKIIKTIATRCQISRLKCTKFDFGWGYAPDPPGGAYSAPPDLLAGLRGPTCKGKEAREGKGKKGRGKEGRGMDEGKGEGGGEKGGVSWICL